MSTAKTISSRAAKRAKSRGAAMIEAAVVLVTIVVTWGAMATAYTNGSAKLNAQWNARASTMYHASNECKKQMAGGSVGGGGAAGELPTNSGDSEADAKSNNAPIDGGAAKARSTFFFAAGSATATKSLARWSASKASSSWAVCNEGKYAGNPLGLLAYGYDLFRDLMPGPIQAIFPH